MNCYNNHNNNDSNTYHDNNQQNNSFNLQRNQTNNNNQTSYENRYINNNHNQYNNYRHNQHNNNHSNYYQNTNHNRYNNYYNRHNNNRPSNHYQNNYNNNNNYHQSYHNRPNNNYQFANNNRQYRPSPTHEIISQHTGALIVQQKKESQPYFYDPQRPIAMRAMQNKSQIMNNPVLDMHEKYRLIRNDQIYAIQEEEKKLNDINNCIDYTNNRPCSPEPETDNENDNQFPDIDINIETHNNNGIPNVKFGDMIQSNGGIMEYTQNYEMINENGDKKKNLLCNEDENKFGIYSKDYVHTQAMMIPDKHTLGDCIDNANVVMIKGKGKGMKNGKKGKKRVYRRRGGKKRNNNVNLDEMNRRERQDYRIKVEANALSGFLEDIKQNTRKNIIKS